MHIGGSSYFILWGRGAFGGEHQVRSQGKFFLLQVFANPTQVVFINNKRVFSTLAGFYPVGQQCHQGPGFGFLGFLHDGRQQLQ